MATRPPGLGSENHPIERLESKLELLRSDMNGRFLLLNWMVGLSLALCTGILALLARLAIVLPHP